MCVCVCLRFYAFSSKRTVSYSFHSPPPHADSKDSALDCSVCTFRILHAVSARALSQISQDSSPELGTGNTKTVLFGHTVQVRELLHLWHVPVCSLTHSLSLSLSLLFSLSFYYICLIPTLVTHALDSHSCNMLDPASCLAASKASHPAPA